jgi:hypothetical protein
MGAEQRVAEALEAASSSWCSGIWQKPGGQTVSFGVVYTDFGVVGGGRWRAVEIKGGAWKQACREALAQKAGMDVAKTSAVLDCKISSAFGNYQRQPATSPASDAPMWFAVSNAGLGGN